MDGAIFISNSLALADWQNYALIGLSSAFILYVVFKPSFRKRDPLTNQPLRFSVSQQKNLERDMQNLLVELHEMARTMTAQIETRAAKLELLIRDADEKIARLEGRPASRPAEHVAVDEPPHVDVYSLADAGVDARQIAQRLQRPVGEIELLLALRRRGRADFEVSEPPAIAG
jgi:hypothetical protein